MNEQFRQVIADARLAYGGTLPEGKTWSVAFKNADGNDLTVNIKGDRTMRFDEVFEWAGAYLASGKYDAIKRIAKARRGGFAWSINWPQGLSLT